MHILWLFALVLSTVEGRQGRDCSRPEHPEHGTVSIVGPGHVRYYCHVGYKLRGHSENFCLAGSVPAYWTFDLPVCEVLLCPMLPPILYGEYTNDIVEWSESLHGTETDVECAYGTEVNGTSLLKCVAGIWNNDPPGCEPVYCDPVDTSYRHIELVYGDTQVGDVMKFRCTDSSLTLYGDNMIYCLPEKEYNKPLPYCAGNGTPPPQCRNIPRAENTKEILHRGDYCYNFIDEEMPFYDALDLCKSNYGFLVNIDDEQTNKWLVKVMASLTDRKAWLGLKYTDDDEWEWLGLYNEKRPLGSYDQMHGSSWGHCTYLSEKGQWVRSYCKNVFSTPEHNVICQYPAEEY